MRSSRILVAAIFLPLSANAGNSKASTTAKAVVETPHGRTATPVPSAVSTLTAKAPETKALDTKLGDAKTATDVAPKGSKLGTQKTATPAAKKVAPPKPKPVCLSPANHFTAGSLESSIALTTCAGEVAPLAVDKLSLVAQPRWASAPIDLDKTEPALLSTQTLPAVPSVSLLPRVPALAVVPPLAPSLVKGTVLSQASSLLGATANSQASTLVPSGAVASAAKAKAARGRVDAGIAIRLAAIAKHFGKPNKPARFFVVSGYRPGSRGSLHAAAKAFDVRVEGVSNEALVAYCKQLEDTGCGYYPNSSFVHVDVRQKGAGHVSWIDISGPGENANYVTAWPPKPGQREEPQVPTELLPKELEDDGHGPSLEDSRPFDDAESVETTWLDEVHAPGGATGSSAN